MKKAISILAVSLCLHMLWGGPAYAGSLNDNESELISIISGTYDYEGVTYKVKDLYIDMAIDYLMQDGIDLTDEQKQAAMQKMYSSVAQGISEGYLEVVSGADNDGEEPGTVGGASDAGQGITGQQGTESAGLKITEGVDHSQEAKEATISPFVSSLESLAQMETPPQETSDTIETNRFPEGYPHYSWPIAWYLCAAVGLGTIGCAAAGKRKRRKTVSRVSAVLLLCDISLMISAAFFHFGVYDQALLALSFEKSGYYKASFEEAQVELFAVLDESGIPDAALQCSDLELSFERRMRSQVLNRGDSAAELNSITMAKEMIGWTDARELDLTPRAEEGIVRLSERLSRILYDKSEILGLEGWHGDASLFSKGLSLFLIILGALFFACTALIGYLQSRKHRLFTYLAAGFAGAALIGVIQSGVVSLLMQTETGGAMGRVMAAYRREIVFVGLKISAAVFVIAVLLEGFGFAMKKMQQR